MNNLIENQIARVQQIVKSAAKFSDRTCAFEVSYRIRQQGAKGGAVVVLGDDSRYWVVTSAEAGLLEKAAYELA